MMVATWYPTDANPVGGIFVQEQARILARRHDVIVVAPVLRGLREIAKTGYTTGVSVEKREGLTVLRPVAHALVPRRFDWRQAAASYDNAVERAYRKVLQIWGRPTMIHAQVVYPGGWAAVRLAKREGLPSVLTEHSGPFSMHLISPLMTEQVRWTLENADVVVTVSRVLEREIREFTPNVKELVVVGNVIDTDFFKPMV